MPEPETLDLPTFDDVTDAADRLKGIAVETPLLRHDALDARAGGRVFVKAESLQRTGSFKIRGAYNRLSRLTAAERMTGVVAFSSGNHAQGVAAAAALVGVEAIIVMPRDAPRTKIEGAVALGAQIEFYDRATQSREDIAARIAADRGAVVVPSFDDFHVIAGQGTVGLEIGRQMQTLGVGLDRLFCPVSGGGLLSGIALALGELAPDVSLHGVEPAVHDDLAQSLAAGRRVEVRPEVNSLCDGLQSPAPGLLPFAILQSRLAGALAVSDTEVLEAMAFAFVHFKLVLEPSGAAALAAVLNRSIDLAGGAAVVVATGGNVDAEVYLRALQPAP